MKLAEKDILGYRFCRMTLVETVELLAKWSEEEQERARYFCCVNPHSIEVSRKDPEFAEAIHASDLVTADGTGIIIASRILNAQIPERVCGPDIFPDLCTRLNTAKAGTRMFFLGSDDENLAVLERKFRQEFPHLECVGTYAPPFAKVFSDDQNAEIISRVNASGADILWVGLGAPKQEKWAFEHCRKLNVKVVGPVGGVFDFFSGRVKLPPQWVQKIGGISIYRLLQEPRRLWRRNLNGPIFLMRVLGQLFREGRYKPSADKSCD
ncbi:MAG: WecB/TagA/CpsF family glycosyltransferase [Puniceicoccaceae bacterium]